MMSFMVYALSLSMASWARGELHSSYVRACAPRTPVCQRSRALPVKFKRGAGRVGVDKHLHNAVGHIEDLEGEAEEEEAEAT